MLLAVLRLLLHIRACLFPRLTNARLRLSERASEAVFWKSSARVYFQPANARWSQSVWRDFSSFLAEKRRRRRTKQGSRWGIEDRGVGSECGFISLAGLFIGPLLFICAIFGLYVRLRTAGQS